jgi:predicted molibdopterin-dependent oxidoreductase YjgC
MMKPIKDREGRYLRLTQPLVREQGVLRPATWDEALDRAADGFRRAIGRRGPDTAGIFRSSRASPSARTTSIAAIERDTLPASSV